MAQHRTPAWTGHCSHLPAEPLTALIDTGAMSQIEPRIGPELLATSLIDAGNGAKGITRKSTAAAAVTTLVIAVTARTGRLTGTGIRQGT